MNRVPVLKMSQDKTLVITKFGNTYQDENNAENLKIILPNALNGNDLKDCHIYLNFVNNQGLGDVCDITEYLKDYSENYYVVEVPLYQMFTYEPGNIEMWIKVLHSPTEMVAKTNEITYTIKEHREIEGAIPEQEMSIIDSLTMRIDATDTKVDEVSDRVQDIVDGEEQIVQPMLISKIHEENKEE